MIVLSKASTEVLMGSQDSMVGAGADRSLEKSINHPLPSGDVLLIIGDVGRQPLPSVLIGLLLLINLRDNLKFVERNLGLFRS